MPHNTKITATIITLNEADTIVECIQNVRQVCSEVIVLDSNSTDSTRMLAQKSGAIVHSQSYLGDGLQKAKAAEFATNDWILSIDADERLDKDAIETIHNLSLDNNALTAYAFRRKNYVGTHRFSAGGFYPDYVTRLYNRTQSRYSKVKRHGKVNASRIVRTNAHIIHYTYKSISHWIQRIDALSTRDAWAMYSDGVQPKSAGGHALSAFIKQYIINGSMFQGQDGVTVAVNAAFFCYMKYLKLKQLHQDNTSSEQQQASNDSHDQ